VRNVGSKPANRGLDRGLEISALCR
jgi:hypothetical protein